MELINMFNAVNTSNIWWRYYCEDIATIYKSRIDSVSISSLFHYTTIQYLKKRYKPVIKGNRRFLNNSFLSSNIKGLN